MRLVGEALLGLLALAACGGPIDGAVDGGVDGGVVCDEERWALGWDDEGLPSAGTPPTWTEDEDIPFERFDGTGTQVHFWYPWDLNARQAYYLRAGEDVHVRVRVMQGTEAVGEGIFKLWPFVEGRPVEVVQRERSVSVVTAPVEDGLAELVFRMPAELFGRGLNAVHFHSYVDREVSGIDYLSGGAWPLTVARETAELPAEIEVTPGYEVEEAVPGYATTVWWDRPDWEEEYPLVLLLEGLPWEGDTIPVVVRAQADPRERSCFARTNINTFSLVGMLDGAPHPLGDRDRIVARVPHGEQHVLRFDLTLPRDGERHRFELLVLPGLGRPARLAGGDHFPPWSFSQPSPTIIRYGPDP